MMRLISAALLTFLFLAGCTSNAGAGKVGITVTNDKGVPIQNCSISLSVPVAGANGYYGKTDINGFILFESGLHVYYDVYVWKGLWEGCDFVEIKPGNTLNKTIIIYPPGTQFNGCL